jgi:hypothetical protein
MNKDQKLLAEAYDVVLRESEAGQDFYDILKTLEPGKIYSYKDSDISPQYNYWIFTSEPGYKRAGIRRLGTQGARVLTDYSGKQQADIKDIQNLVPSEMSQEDFKAQDEKALAAITQSVQSQRYSD